MTMRGRVEHESGFDDAIDAVAAAASLHILLLFLLLVVAAVEGTESFHPLREMVSV